MAAGFDPRQPYPLSLDCFQDVPAEERPTWTFRRVNGAEYVEINSVYEITPETTHAFQEAVLKALQVGLIGWTNQVDVATGEIVPFDPVRIAQIVNAQEAMELIDKRLQRGRLTAGELKNSE